MIHEGSCCDRGSGHADGASSGLGPCDVLFKYVSGFLAPRVPVITAVSTVSRRTFVNRAG